MIAIVSARFHVPRWSLYSVPWSCRGDGAMTYLERMLLEISLDTGRDTTGQSNVIIWVEWPQHLDHWDVLGFLVQMVKVALFSWVMDAHDQWYLLID